MRRAARLFIGAVVVVAAACENRGENRVLGIESMGAVTGAVTFDVNGSRTADAADTVLADVRVGVVVSGGSDTVSTATTDANGLFRIGDVPVGTYTIVVDTTTLAPDAEVVEVDAEEIDVATNDTVSVAVTVSQPLLDRVGALTSVTIGRRVFLVGVALNDALTYGDSTIHVADTSGAVLVTGLRTLSIVVGDSVRLLGTARTVAGRVTLDDPTVFTLGRGVLPTAVSTTTAVAAGADGGRLDAGLVALTGVTIIDTATVDDDFVATVDDGSGPFDVVFDDNAGFQLGPFVPFAVLDVTVLLRRRGSTGTWRGFPRVQADVRQDVSAATTAEVRTVRAEGDQVFVTGVALNTWNVFGDSSVHVQDAAGSLRTVGVAQTAAAAGDSVRVTGVVEVRSGQRVLAGATATVIAAVTPPDPTDQTSGQAANAGGGGLDAGLARVRGAEVVDTATVDGDFIATLNDGSGDLEVMFDADAAVDPTAFVPAAVVEVTGLLVPTVGRWRLKPRSAPDLDVLIPVVTIAEARAHPLGDSVVVSGILLNGPSVFNDRSVHVWDTSGTLRATNLPTAVLLFQGDSVRLRGTLNSQNGQRTLDLVAPTRLEPASVPAPVVVTTGQAASASAPATDAALVRVQSATIATRTVTATEVTLTANDGSGVVEIRIDTNTGIDTDDFLEGNVVDATGILVARGNGVWRVKPRVDGDVEEGAPVVTAAAARALPAGDRVFVEGVVLNDLDTFGDSTAYLSDATGFILGTGVSLGTFAAGDSIRLLGTVAMQGGQPVLANAITFALAGTGTAPSPTVLTTATAATASGGTLDAGLVRVDGAAVIDTNTVDGDLVLTVEDGSGPLDVVLDQDAGLTVNQLVPPVEIDLVGLMRPDGAGGWHLLPRTDADLTVNVPFASTSDIRNTLAPGDTVLLVGTALNDFDVYADGLVHVRDQLGPIQTVLTGGPVTAGDSVRIRGVVASVNGQRRLTAGTASILQASAGAPSSVSVSTDAAANATGAAGDAALVEVTGATVSATLATAEGLRATVDDGSGALQIVFDTDIAFDLSEIVPGAVLDVEGLLVATGLPSWRLKPRGDGDVTVAVPVVTVAEARALALGTEVVVVGVALNDRTTFGDQTVHLTDPSGTIRATNVAAVTIFAGDSVRLRGTLSTTAGQRTLDNVTPVRFTNVGAPGPTDLTSAIAATANGGAADAALTRVLGVEITARNTVGIDIVLTADDGSGAVDIVLDGDAGIVATEFVAGAIIDATGVLVPTGTGTWRLKPRSNADVVVRVPVVTVDAARNLPAGDTVVIGGVALNAAATFGDSTLHLTDGTASIRATAVVPGTVFQGDSVRLRGIIGSRNGQPTIDSVVVTFLNTSAVPGPLVLTIPQAVSASGGRDDARLVQVVNATIDGTATVGGDFVITIDDMGQQLEIVLDGDIGFDTTPYMNGVVITVTGVLVPAGGGTWQLKPRAETDIT